jgi:hypothetical protein
MALEIRTDGGRWVKQDGFSEVGQRMNDGGLKPDDEDVAAGCIICQQPPVTYALMNSWREHDGEPIIATVRVCDRHRGQWYFIPDALQHTWDASTQRSPN